MAGPGPRSRPGSPEQGSGSLTASHRRQRAPSPRGDGLPRWSRVVSPARADGGARSGSTQPDAHGALVPLNPTVGERAEPGGDRVPPSVTTGRAWVTVGSLALAHRGLGLARGRRGERGACGAPALTGRVGGRLRLTPRTPPLGAGRWSRAAPDFRRRRPARATRKDASKKGGCRWERAGGTGAAGAGTSPPPLASSQGQGWRSIFSGNVAGAGQVEPGRGRSSTAPSSSRRRRRRARPGGPGGNGGEAAGGRATERSEGGSSTVASTRRLGAPGRAAIRFLRRTGPDLTPPRTTVASTAKPTVPPTRRTAPAGGWSLPTDPPNRCQGVNLPPALRAKHIHHLPASVTLPHYV